MVLRCVGGAVLDVAELATGISPPDGNGTGGILGKDVALLIPSIERPQCIPSQAEPALWSEDVSYPQPRRVIHSYPQSIKYTSVDSPGKQDGRMPHASKQKGRPAEAGLPCKNLESRISAQQHRRNGKSIQCPSNVTTYIGHTLFVGSALKLFSYFVIMLSNPAIANRNRLMFPIYRNCCFAIARITKMFRHVRNARRVCLIACVCSKNAACRRFILHNERTNVNSC